MTRVNFLIQCEPCGKRLYRTRRAAKHALRVLHPQERGRMAAYPCPNGNTGHHIGHRPGLHATPAWPAWADTTVELRCDRCDQLVRVGEPVAYTCGDAVCIDCGEVAEREAIAHRNTHPAGPIPHTAGEAS